METKEENLLWKGSEYGCFTVRVKKDYQRNYAVN